MTPKLSKILSKCIKWLLPAGLLFILVLGFVKTPEVSSRLFPYFRVQDTLFQLRLESRRAEARLSWVKENIDSLLNKGRTDPRMERLIKKDLVSITRSLRYINAISATLNRDLEARLLHAPSDQGRDLRAFLAEIKTLQLKSKEYRRRLEEECRKVRYSQARVDD